MGYNAYGHGINYIDRLVVEFSWKRFLSAVILLSVAIFAFLFYEWYTNQFYLARVEKTVALVEKLSDLKEKGTVEKDPELNLIYQNIIADLKQHVPVSDPKNANHKMDGLQKFIYSASSWLLLLIPLFIWIRQASKGKKESSGISNEKIRERWAIFIYTIIMIFIIGCIGAFLPFNYIINYFYYSFITLLFSVAYVALGAMRAIFPTSKSHRIPCSETVRWRIHDYRNTAFR